MFLVARPFSLLSEFHELSLYYGKTVSERHVSKPCKCEYTFVNSKRIQNINTTITDIVSLYLQDSRWRSIRRCISSEHNRTSDKKSPPIAYRRKRMHAAEGVGAIHYCMVLPKHFRIFFPINCTACGYTYILCFAYENV